MLGGEMEKKKYCAKGIINELLPEIKEYVLASSPEEAWKIIKKRLQKKYGWWYRLSQEKVEITEV